MERMKTIKKIAFCFLVLLLAVPAVLTKTTRADQAKLAILLYHHILPSADITPDMNNGLVISREVFADQMAYLYKNNYHIVTSGELRDFLYQKKPLPAKSVMITFDDGYMSSYMFAYPILKQYGYKAVMFAITGSLQTKDLEFSPEELNMLSWMQVAASTDVFEYGSHTNALHAPINGRTGLAGAASDTARADLLYSQKRLGNSRLFSYPLGQYTDQIVDILRNNGFDLAFTINKGYVTQNSNPMLLNRVTVYSGINLKTFESVVTCQYAYK